MTDTLVMRIDDHEYVLEYWDTTDASLCPACPVCMKMHTTWFTLTARPGSSAAEWRGRRLNEKHPKSRSSSC